MKFEEKKYRIYRKLVALLGKTETERLIKMGNELKEKNEND
tara:strand:+ start:1861 stop:1983 length:123 start_codon:yes stop_codon:yes gene_type:complete